MNNTQPQFDVFLAHNNADKTQVLFIANQLKHRGLNPWLDDEQIPPGRPFQDEIQRAIPLVKSAAIFLGPQGLGPWQLLELRSFISECVKNKIPVLPVLLPGVNEVPPHLHFLREFRWVSFANKLDDDQALHLLQWGITGRKPDKIQQDEEPGRIPTQEDISIIQTLLDFHRKYCKWLISKCENYRTEGLSPLGSLFLSDVFVPLKVAPNYPENANSRIIPLKDYKSNSQKTIWNFLVAAAGNTPQSSLQSIVVLGPPGSGKTTLLKHLSITYAKKEEKKDLTLEVTNNEHEKSIQKISELIPIFLLIREVYQKIINKQPLSDLIAEQTKLITKEIQTLQSLSQWFAEELEQGQCLVMLDGLDEVADESQRRTVSSWVDQQIETYPKSIFILTSRPRGYRDASLKNAGIVLEVQPFNLELVREFIHKWYLATEKIGRSEDEISEIEKQAQQQSEDLINRIRNSSPLAAMAVNPLLLTMISKVHHQLSLDNMTLPKRRVKLYKEMCRILLEDRQKEKYLLDTLTDRNKQSVLQILAIKLMQQRTTEFQLDDGVDWIKEQLALVFSNEINPENFIEHICDISGLLVEKELNYYQFPHLSFQEYLAAVQVKDLNQEDLLITNINESWWAETIRLYAAENNATTLIRTVLDMQSPSIDVMALAYDCLEECVRVDDNVRQQLIKRLEDGLESTDPEAFKLAAQVRLIRRFRNFVRINEELEIDNSYITCAEYQLFLDETREPHQPQHWQSNRFPAGNAEKTITGISWENALKFCAWLGEWYRTRFGNQLGEMVVHYRLPKKEEINLYFINDDRLFAEDGICLVKFQLPLKYSKLADYLWSREWKEADKETANVMFQVSGRESQGYLDEEAIENFPCEVLRIIDQLWTYASKGHFGFSVQKDIYQSLGGSERTGRKGFWGALLNAVVWVPSYVAVVLFLLNVNICRDARGRFPKKVFMLEKGVREIVRGGRFMTHNVTQKLGRFKIKVLCALLSRRDL